MKTLRIEIYLLKLKSAQVGKVKKAISKFIKFADLILRKTFVRLEKVMRSRRKSETIAATSSLQG